MAQRPRPIDAIAYLPDERQARGRTRRARQIDDIAYLLNRIEAALVVQNPGTIHAAEAFDGLRKTLLYSAKSRRAHVSHLVALKDSIDRGASIELLSERVNDFLMELGVQYITDVSKSDHFIFDGDENGPECVTPAVVDVAADGTEVTIRKGHARRPTPTPTSMPAEPDDTGASTSAGAESTMTETETVPTETDDAKNIDDRPEDEQR